MKLVRAAARWVENWDIFGGSFLQFQQKFVEILIDGCSRLLLGVSGLDAGIYDCLLFNFSCILRGILMHHTQRFYTFPLMDFNQKSSSVNSATSESGSFLIYSISVIHPLQSLHPFMRTHAICFPYRSVISRNWIHLLNNVYKLCYRLRLTFSSGLARSMRIINFDFNLYDNTLTKWTMLYIM